MVPRPPIMPILTGSPKSVAWSEVVCAKRIPELLALSGNDCERGYAEALIQEATSASWWIDLRSEEAASLAMALLNDFSGLASRPADGTPEPDMESPVRFTEAPERLIAEVAASIRKSSATYHFSPDAVAERVNAGLSPGDTWVRRRAKMLYLGNNRMAAIKLGAYGIALNVIVVDDPKHLDAMLMLLANDAGLAAVRKPRAEIAPSPASPCRKPMPPTMVLRRALILADSVEIGGTIASGADSVIEAIEGFEGGVVVELGQPFFGRHHEAKDLLVQFAYVRRTEAE